MNYLDIFTLENLQELFERNLSLLGLTTHLEMKIFQITPNLMRTLVLKMQIA